MKKLNVKTLGILAFSASAFTAFALLVPFRHGAGFWIAFAASILAFILQIPLFKSVFSRSDTLNSKFLGLPLIRVGYTYLGIQIATSITMFALGFVPGFPAWLSAVVCAVILCAALACSLTASAAVYQIRDMELKSAQDQSTILQLRLSADSLCDAATDPSLKQALRSLAEDFRYSDPVGGASVYQQESALMNGFSSLRNAVISGNTEQSLAICEDVKKLLRVRNAACKQIK